MAPRKNVWIPEEHHALAGSLGVTAGAVKELARFCEGPLEPLEPRTARGEPVAVPGAPPAMMVAFRGDPIDTHSMELDDAVARDGLTAFLCGGRELSHEGWLQRRLAILRRGDPWDPLRAVGTAAPDEGVGAGDVIAALREWEETWRFRLRGAGPDWFELYCREGQDRFGELATAVNKRWPSLVRSGHRTRRRMLHQMETLGCLWLFWKR